MSNVTLTIAGRHYTVACGAGEEQHIVMLGEDIDGKLSGMPGLAHQTEARTLLYAALLLADELHEARQGAPAPTADNAAELEAIAGQLEDLAARLENG